MFGIRRSGNHVVCDWIKSQFKGNYVHGRNIQPDFFSFLNKEREKLESMGEIACFIAGIEEQPIAALDIVYCEEADVLYKVLILRDPYNLFASRIKHYKLFDYRHFNAKFTTYNWLDYAYYFLSNPKDVICISYNRFVQDRDYRKDIAHQLNTNFDEGNDIIAMKNVYSGTSDGSSFDGTRLDGKGTEMKVLDRWKAYKDDKRYQSLFTDEIRRLSEALFNFNPL